MPNDTLLYALDIRIPHEGLPVGADLLIHLADTPFLRRDETGQFPNTDTVMQSILQQVPTEARAIVTPQLTKHLCDVPVSISEVQKAYPVYQLLFLLETPMPEYQGTRYILDSSGTFKQDALTPAVLQEVSATLSSYFYKSEGMPTAEKYLYLYTSTFADSCACLKDMFEANTVNPAT